MKKQPMLSQSLLFSVCFFIIFLLAMSQLRSSFTAIAKGNSSYLEETDEGVTTWQHTNSVLQGAWPKHRINF